MIGIEVIKMDDRLIGDFAIEDAAKKRTLMIPTALVKAMLGGKWPKAKGFNFDIVQHFRIEKDEELGAILVPYDAFDPAPGPDFRLVMMSLPGMFDELFIEGEVEALERKFREAEEIITKTKKMVEEVKEIFREIKQIAEEKGHQDILDVLDKIPGI